MSIVKKENLSFSDFVHAKDRDSYGLSPEQATVRIFRLACDLERLMAKMNWILDHNPNLTLPGKEDIKHITDKAESSVMQKYRVTIEEMEL